MKNKGLAGFDLRYEKLRKQKPPTEKPETNLKLIIATLALLIVLGVLMV